MLLRRGLRLWLPSGNVVLLEAKDGADWLCVFEAGSTQRGEVMLSAAWLKRFAVRV